MTPTATRILLVEDDDVLRVVVAEALRDAGYLVAVCARGDEAISAAAAHHPDLALLDVMLPGRSGLEVAKALRDQADLPIVFLTALDGVNDRLTGFELGADDYLVKPFALAELLARIRAVLRRSGRLSENVLEIGDLIIDEDAGAAHRAGRTVELTATEFVC